MTVSDKQTRHTLHPARLLRRKAVVAAKIAGALPDLMALADTVMAIQAIKLASGIRAQKRIEL